jgi:hypothetical protein
VDGEENSGIEDDAVYSGIDMDDPLNQREIGDLVYRMNLMYFDNSLLLDCYKDTSFNLDIDYQNIAPRELGDSAQGMDADERNSYYKLDYVPVELHHKFFDLLKNKSFNKAELEQRKNGAFIPFYTIAGKVLRSL